MLYFYSLSAVFLFALVPLVIKLTDANPFSIGIFRLWGASLLLAAITRTPLQRLFSPLLVTIGCVFFLHWLTYFFAVKWTSISLAVIALSTYGIQLTLIDSIVHKKFPHWTTCMGIAVAFFGTCLCSLGTDFSSQGGSGFLIGLASGFFYACLPLLHKKAAQKFSESERAVSQFFFAAIFFVFFIGEANFANLELTDYYYLLYLTIGGTLIGHSLWVRISTEFPTQITSVIYYLVIPLAALLEFFVLKAELPTSTLIGGVFVVAGNLLVVFRGARASET